MEDIWTGLRNFLHPFRGVHKKYLAIYVAMFEWAHNLKRVTADLRACFKSKTAHLHEHSRIGS
jgi:transposase-like protein